jgi:hypothetical protein
MIRIGATLDDVVLLRAALARSQREVESLRERIRELERFDQVERMQIERMRAAAEARRIEGRSRPLVSPQTIFLAAYSVFAAVVTVLIALGMIYR